MIKYKISFITEKYKTKILKLRDPPRSTRFLTLSWEAPDSTDNDITGYSVFYQEEGSERYIFKPDVTTKLSM